MTIPEHRRHATAYWTVRPGEGELRTEELPEPGADEALVRALYSGISRGTELLVHQGQVPDSVADAMRAPHQDGDFPAPVKYGYLSVGVVEQGPDDWTGQAVFCLHPHQDRYVVPLSELTRIPDGVPPRRAVLTGMVETALNALWEAGPRLGDRVAVVGGGLLGGTLATLLRKFPLDRLELVEVDPAKERIAEELGIAFAHPDKAQADCDLVFHCSATSDGLRRSLQLAGDEATVIELSWYGDKPVEVPLGEDFHARRLSIIASQVGVVAKARRHRRSTAERLATAVGLLEDPAFDLFLSQDTSFADLPTTMENLADGGGGSACPVVSYRAPQPEE
ncbi:threonine dehydrogenase-like Zn-dependent dehydrogenase [Arthrobacter woluwensis]|uniref:zinc-dependent alcohol dehydrogenase n=1 Tax=Arthrobacter woluwensis TaxID=156980 RepID=UPI00277FF0DA|nr:zinc-binding alcohol dehydrogenase [Arthrobacter woluwensis]MDQ0709857.1 threonine dehydrogenase-like Zn-dependent dehydrogenase [Arthrobacter woluwensis]